MSRRSNNFYTTSPKSDGIDESIDSYVGALQCEDEKTQDTTQMTERRSSSAVSEQFSKSTPEMDREVEQEQMQQDEQASQLVQASPIVQIEEELETETEQNTSSKRSTINFSCAPPKKRLKGNNTAYSSENFIDIKVGFIIRKILHVYLISS